MTIAVELERQLVRELSKAYRDANSTYFKDALRSPVLELVATEAFLGRWSSEHRRLSLSRSLVVERPWGSVIEVLKHEMAHQYVDEVLGARDEAPHGKAFRDVCARMGIDAAATGLPDARLDNPLAHNPVVDKVARLLALTSSPNQHEAEAAAVAARRLMARYNLEPQDADPSRAGYTFIHKGRVTGRVEEHERVLAMILGKHYFVEVIWVPSYRASEGKRGSVLEVCGTNENVAIASYVFDFLARTADELWDKHRKATNERSNRDRRTFLAGVMTGFLEKLKSDEAAARGEGLVWVGSKEVSAFLRKRHPYVRHIRHGGRSRSEAFDEGRNAGRNIVIRKGVESHGGPPRLLGSSR